MEEKIENFELYQYKLKVLFNEYIRKPFPEILISGNR